MLMEGKNDEENGVGRKRLEFINLTVTDVECGGYAGV